MTKYPFIDEMPEADEGFIRSHRHELLALAAELGITNVRVSSTGRMVGCTGPDSAPLAPYAFTAQAGMRLERIVRMYSDDVATKPGASEDLREAVPRLSEPASQLSRLRLGDLTRGHPRAPGPSIRLVARR